MYTYPTALASELHFLTSEDDLGERGNLAVAELAAHGMVASLGIHESQVPRLGAMAEEDHIVEYCPNDRKVLVAWRW